jgi:hypothetical protein
VFGICGLLSTALIIGPMEGSSKHDNETLGSIKCWEVLE